MLEYSPVIRRLELSLPYQVDVLRLDLTDAEISGNKWFKLKYNLEKARRNGIDKVLTFGGAHSNHIAATATACRRTGMQCIGVIRGGPMPVKTPTLEKAEADGMTAHYISREQYAQKENPEFIMELSRLFGDFYLIPEGGMNIEGVYGCMEILKKEWNYDYVFCACGTGTTYAGLVASANPGTRIIGISPLKGINTLPVQVNNLLHRAFQNRFFSVKAADNDFPAGEHFITGRYAFSGFAAFDKDVKHFKYLFEKEHGITLDYIYTGKLFFGLFQMMQERVIPEGSKILVIHTGGIQSNAGFEKRYQLNPSL